MSVRTEQFGSHSTDFHEILNLSIFRKSVKKIQISLKSDKNNAYFTLKPKHIYFNPLNAELNPICYLLALLGAHHFLHVRRIRVKSLILRLLMSYIYGAPILDVSRSHTTTQHSR